MKKSQLQLGESTATVVVIIMMILIGLVFYSRISQVNANKAQLELGESSTIELASAVTAIPELHCTFQQSASANCFDTIKIKYFSELVSADTSVYLYYTDIFGNARIELEQIYPEENITLIYENNKSEQQSKSLVIIPVNLYDPVEKTFSFGALHITKYT